MLAKTLRFMKCTKELTATTIQENRNKETINGNLIQQSIAMVMEKRKFSMVQQWLSIMRGFQRNSPKQS